MIAWAVRSRANSAACRRRARTARASTHEPVITVTVIAAAGNGVVLNDSTASGAAIRGNLPVAASAAPGSRIPASAAGRHQTGLRAEPATG
ncbi:hypothetical protein MB27_29975 [Actinoplanes utahensis]|uniref:Uncharacterized protein n=1 Tax=Actinoplanes utahensis TaxID=1869 RepID=A0A0A6UFL9_ACTUT|nr:hypothetical protein MB27_29975 [Actinoplanes utahensis]